MKFNRKRSTWKNLLLVGVLLLVQLFSAGCGGDMASKTMEERDPSLVIVTSFYPMYIITLNIVQDVPGVVVYNLTSSAIGCLHDYQLTPADMKIVEKADIMIVNGAGMEGFMDQIMTRQKGLQVIDASKGIPLIKDESGENNPHVWVSISLAMQQVKNIAQQLMALDPLHAKQYSQNSKRYLETMQSLRDRMHEELKDIESRDIVTFHEAFPYFAQEFNLRVVAVVEREPGTAPSPEELAGTIELVRKTGVRAVFVEPQYPDKMAQVIARETEAQVYTLDPAATGPQKADAYLKAMERNLLILKEALGK